MSSKKTLPPRVDLAASRLRIRREKGSSATSSEEESGAFMMESQGGAAPDLEKWRARARLYRGEEQEILEENPQENLEDELPFEQYRPIQRPSVTDEPPSGEQFPSFSKKEGSLTPSLLRTEGERLARKYAGYGASAFLVALGAAWWLLPFPDAISSTQSMLSLAPLLGAPFLYSFALSRTKQFLVTQGIPSVSSLLLEHAGKTDSAFLFVTKESEQGISRLVAVDLLEKHIDATQMTLLMSEILSLLPREVPFVAPTYSSVAIPSPKIVVEGGASQVHGCFGEVDGAPFLFGEESFLREQGVMVKAEDLQPLKEGEHLFFIVFFGKIVARLLTRTAQFATKEEVEFLSKIGVSVWLLGEEEEQSLDAKALALHIPRGRCLPKVSPDEVVRRADGQEKPVVVTLGTAELASSVPHIVRQGRSSGTSSPWTSYIPLSEPERPLLGTFFLAARILRFLWTLLVPGTFIWAGLLLTLSWEQAVLPLSNLAGAVGWVLMGVFAVQLIPSLIKVFSSASSR